MTANSAERPHVARDARGKRPQFYDTPGLDQAMSMILVLANEVSVLHDRLDSAERVLKSHNLDVAAGIESLVLDQAALESREAWRQDFLQRLYYLATKDARDAAQGNTTESFGATISEIATT